ncbi:MAG TPA: cation:proton antiporter [Thermoanaerobaculia bacterium]|nr:cation:proton antiporter [Thermoanaerobaculia bacterium]
MTEIEILRQLGLILLAAAGALLLARLARIPSIVSYLVAGLALGPATGLLPHSEPLELISHVGIALLLFLVGLELSLDKIRDLGKVAVAAGLGQVAFTAVGGFALAWALGFPPMEALFLGVALTFSSTVVVVKILDQKRELDTLYGRIAVGIFLVQDLVVIVALTLLAGLGREEGDGLGTAALGVLLAFAGMAALLVTALLSSRYLLPPVFGWAASSAQTLFIWSLAWCFLFVVAAERLQLSLEIGAFLAGISLAQLPFNRDLRRRVHPLMNFFIAVFFVTLGARTDITAALDLWPAALTLTLFVLLGNPLIFLWIIARMGYGERTAFLTSVTVAQISEFSFIFAGMGLASGLIDQGVLAVIAVVGFVTIAASAFMILYNHQLYGWTRRLGLLRPFRARPESFEEAVEVRGGPSGHVIVVGMNDLGRRLVAELCRRGVPAVAVDTDPAKLAGLPCPGLLGDSEHSSVLEEAGLDRARLLVSTLKIEDTNNFLAYRCRRAGVPAAIHQFDASVRRDLQRLGVAFPMSSKAAGLRRILAELEHEGILRPWADSPSS